jgi:hypothetical protein
LKAWTLTDKTPPLGLFKRQAGALPLRIQVAAILRARTDYANRACNVTCNVMLVAKLVPRTADEPSAQRTASILRSLIDRTAFHRHRDECLYCKKSNSAHNICLSLIHTRRINNSTSFRFTAVILLTTS